jgi:hypothetical protein
MLYPKPQAGFAKPRLRSFFARRQGANELGSSNYLMGGKLPAAYIPSR